MRDTIQVWVVTVAALLTTGGCATVTERLANRITCTVAQDKSYLVSLWGFFGIASEIDARDANTFCAAKANADKAKESK